MCSDFGFNRDALFREDARRGYQRYLAVSANPIVHVNSRARVDVYITGGAGTYGQFTGFRASSRDRFSDYGLISTCQFYKPG
jgi:hypothetical protein